METPTVINADTFWASLSQVNEMSGKYQIDLGSLSDAAVEALESKGLTVANKQDERGNYITCKSKNPIKAYNPAGDEMPIMIGNGSKAKAVLGSYDWEFKGKKGRSPSLVKLIITDLEEYASIAVTDDVLEEAL
jgi:hypothetical protein